MCCRYYIKGKMYEELPTQVIPEAGRRYTGDVGPAGKALILRMGSRGMQASDLFWGYPAVNSGALVINARSESLLQKPMFCEDMMKRRCLIPASGFYEWDAKKQKAEISVPDLPLIYFAGIYGIHSGMERFVIITGASRGEMCRIHDRMPLIIPGDRIEDWFLGDYMELLKAKAPLLKVKIENEQLSFL